MTLDPTGNIYLAGHFGGTVDFDPGPGEHVVASEGESDFFVAKFERSGEFIWAASFAGDIVPYFVDIASDSAGNAIVVGRFTGAVDFDPSEGTHELSNASISDSFVLKLNADGGLLWVRNAGGAEYVWSECVSFDESDHIYVSGTFTHSNDVVPGFGSRIFDSSPAGKHPFPRGFLIKLNSDGEPIWGQGIEGSGSSRVASVHSDQDGNLYTAGTFSDTADLDPGPLALKVTSVGHDDLFIQRLTAEGELVWGKVLGGSTYDGVAAIAPDGLGNVYVGGFFVGTVDFDPGPGQFEITSTGEEDTFVLKLNGDGEFAWVAAAGENDLPEDQWFVAGLIHDLAVDASGNVYSTGYYVNTVDMDPGPGIANVFGRDYKSNAYLQKLDSNGAFQWVKTMGFADGAAGLDVEVSTSDEIHVTGSFTGTVDGDPGPAVLRWSSGDSDYTGFLWKLASVERQPAVLSQILLDVLLAWDYLGLENDTLDFEEASLAQPSVTRFEFDNWDGDKDGLLTVRELTLRAEDSYGCFAARESVVSDVHDNLGDIFTLGLALVALVFLRGGLTRLRD